jgi:hypothetical protein
MPTLAMISDLTCNCMALLSCKNLSEERTPGGEICQGVQSDWYADLLRPNDGPKTEVNSSPGFEGIENASEEKLRASV